MKFMKFKNRRNDETEIVSTPLSWLWVLLFGPVYWAVRGVWNHAIVHLILAILSVGIFHLLYPLITYSIKHLLSLKIASFLFLE